MLLLLLLLLLSTDQLNSTVHGTMKKSPYELAFGQPPHQNFFPGIERTEIVEEDVEDLTKKQMILRMVSVQIIQEVPA